MRQSPIQFFIPLRVAPKSHRHIVRHRLKNPAHGIPSLQRRIHFAEVTQETIFGTLWTRPGLDLKTRALICVISDTATGMFLKDGFDAVRVIDVAAACGVSEKTVYNHFTTKELLILDRFALARTGQAPRRQARPACRGYWSAATGKPLPNLPPTDSHRR